MERITPVWINLLHPNEVFVFGSNLAGRHGAGAAKQAVAWGAKPGKGYGLMGQTFGIPTKDVNLHVLDLPSIEIYIEGFFIKAREASSKYLKFLVTEVGCGRANYEIRDIAPFFTEAMGMENVYLPKRFYDYLKITT